MTTIERVRLITDVLKDHQLQQGIRDMKVHCLCGWNAPSHTGQHKEHQARHIENALFPDAESNDLSAITAERERIAAAAEEIADDLDWDGFMGDLISSRDHAKSLLHRVAAIARGES